MILKYADGVDPFRGEVIGGVYQRYAAGEQMMSTKKNDRYPYALQWQRASTLIGLTRYWRMLSSTEQTAWNTFATTYPQPTQWNPARFLNGYNLFCRWNFFNRLVNGQDAPILTTPAMSVVADSTLTPTITNSGGSLVLDASWSRNGADIWGAVFISRIVSAGNNYIASQPRFITGISNSGGLIIINGFLYNWYAASSTKSICSSGWKVPTYAESFFLTNTFLGGATIAGGKMKETGYDFWNSPNTGATNSSLFFSKGSGYRLNTGEFQNIKIIGRYFCSNSVSTNNGGSVILNYNDAGCISSSFVKKYGASIRPIKISTSLSNGQSGIYIGNDLKEYSTICINNIEYLQQNLCETLYSDGTSIAKVESSLTWSGLTTPAYCSYNNNDNNSFSFLPSTVDISSQYFNMFGRLPLSGEKVLIKVIKFNKISGQFLPEQEFFIDVL